MANVKREVVVEILDKIEERDGFITATAVVEEAKPKSSPIHKHFEWDDVAGGQKYRLHQARQLIRYKYKFVEREPVKEYYNVKFEEGEGGKQGWVSEKRVIKSKNLYIQVLKDAIRRLVYWRERFQHLKELKGVINEGKLADLEKKIGK